MLKLKEKQGQEEIVGFAVIIVIVSIIIIFFLIFSLSGKTQVQSYQSSSFLQASLQDTSSCVINFNYLSVQDLMSSCYNNEKCDNGENSCAALNETLSGILEQSWQVGPDSPTKGYVFNVSSDKGYLFLAKKGNITSVYKQAQQEIPESGASIEVLFNSYA